jgi:hypothetical protein
MRNTGPNESGMNVLAIFVEQRKLAPGLGKATRKITPLGWIGPPPGGIARRAG